MVGLPARGWPVEAWQAHCVPGHPMKYVHTVIALIVVVASSGWSCTRKPREPAVVLAATYDGRIDEYKGGKTLLVAVHTPRARGWPETAAALSKVDRARYDLKLVDAERDKQAVQDLDVRTIPTVIVFRDGREVTRWPNLTSFDDGDDELQ
jgi:hypothetical protein